MTDEKVKELEFKLTECAKALQHVIYLTAGLATLLIDKGIATDEEIELYTEEASKAIINLSKDKKNG